MLRVEDFEQIPPIKANGKKFSVDLDNIEEKEKTETLTIAVSSGRETVGIPITVPKIQKDGSIFLHRNQYVPIVMARKPVARAFGGEVIIEPLAGLIPHIRFFVKNDEPRLWFGRYFRTLYPDTLNRFWLRPCDRVDLNKIIGTTGDETHITQNDIDHIMAGLKDIQDTNWKDIRYLRPCTIQDSLACLIRYRLAWLVRDWPNIDRDRLQVEVDRWFVGNPQVQLDMETTKLGKFALRNKVRLPIARFDDLKTAKADPSWMGVFDCLSTPMSELAGAVVAFADGAGVKDHRFIPSPSGDIFSAHLKKAMPWPQYTHSNRMVMVANLAKQALNLGDHGELNQPPMIQVEGTESIPNIPGRNALMAVMDWNVGTASTHEDSCVVSRSFARKMWATTTRRFRVFSRGQLAGPKEDNEFGHLALGIDDTIGYHRPVAFTYVDDTMPADIEDRAEEFIKEEIVHRKQRCVAHYSKDPLVGRIADIQEFTTSHQGIEVFVTEFHIEYRVRCQEGSKIVGLHSNKHIVSRVVDNLDMPKALINGKWRTIDIIVSPFSIGNRMNPSLLIEAGWGMYLEKQQKDLGLKKPHPMVVKQFDKGLTIEDLKGRLEGVSLPPDLLFPVAHKSRLLKGKVFIGKAFFTLNKNIPQGKLSCSNRLALDHRGLAIRGGRTRGVWLGREEFGCLAGHGQNILEAFVEEAKSINRKTRAKEIALEYLKCLGYSDTCL